MKKVALLLFVLIVFSFTVFAEETFWCLNATANVLSSGDHYRFNYSTVFNLDTYYNYNNRQIPQIGDFNKTNGLDESKAIGTVGVGGCNHAITYTINTNGGKFVSQSDPSKTRNYYVVFVPDYSTTDSTTSRYYYYDGVNYTGTGSNAPGTTATNTITTFTTPITDGTEVQSSSTSGWGWNQTTTYTYYSSIGLDLFLCMSNPSSELDHLALSDDYFATITVSWDCDHNCPEHHGTFDMVVRGYYGTNSGQQRDSFLLIVNPAPDATTLDLKQMIKDDQTKTIASMTIATTTKEGANGSAYPWRDHIYAFLSSSSNYTAPDHTGFVLTKMTNRSITIPYTLTVYNTTSGATMQGQVYDGTDYFIDHDQSYCIDLKDYSKPSTNYYAMSYDRYGTYYYAINYSGRVEINLTNFTIPGTNVDLRTVVNDPVLYNPEYTRYIGKYESNIYYHIVFSD